MVLMLDLISIILVEASWQFLEIQLLLAHYLAFYQIFLLVLVGHDCRVVSFKNGLVDKFGEWPETEPNFEPKIDLLVLLFPEFIAKIKFYVL